MILLVDDTPENIFSLKSLLNLNGFEVDTAASGEEALHKILQHDYAVIVLDVQMPGMDGYEVAEAVTGYSRYRDIPILFLSAVNIDKRFVAKGYASGGVDYITKPVDPDLLLLKIKTFYRLYKQTKQLHDTQASLEKEITVRKSAEQQLQAANEQLEQKVAERTSELVHANKELEASNQELQQYAYLASHDLQEPIRKVLTFGRVVKEKYITEDPQALGYMNRIISASERMRSLIDDLLQYSRLSMQQTFEHTDLNQLLQETLADLDLVIEEKAAVLNVGSLPPADVVPGGMRQVFHNLLTNALKFAKKAEAPCISITADTLAEKSFTAPLQEDGPYLRLRIADNGIGFDEAYLDKIFKIFQRLNGKGEYEGTGIGLAIVKKIIEQHNGLITAESIEGKGSTFIIVLPRRQNGTNQNNSSSQAH